MSKVLEVISRKDADKTVLISDGNFTVAISSPSVIQIRGSAQDVLRYVRQGKDLLIYMKDGSVIRCNGYFVEEEGKADYHSELTFEDDKELTHITFDETTVAAGSQSIELIATVTPIASIEPLLTGDDSGDTPWGWIIGGIVGGGVVGALLTNVDDDNTHHKVIDRTTETAIAKPTFVVTDNAGDSKGMLSTNAVTDDTTPVFSGSGHPGATIQIKDGDGNTIASTMVDSNGSWSVSLSNQADGTHSYSVVQINGNEITSAGSITLNIVTAEAAIDIAVIASDNMLNAAEQANGVTLSGTSKALPGGTTLTITLHDKTYTTTVGSDGSWSVNVPAADSKALADGSWTIAISGKDVTGNTISASETLIVDTKPPVLTLDPLAGDNIINAAEHNAAVIVSGKTDAEAGQTVTLTLDGKTWTATVDADGRWSVSIPAADVQAMADNNYTLNLSVSDKAGNATYADATLLVDTQPPELSVNTVAGDDILSVVEQSQAQIVSGTSRGAAVGDIVTVTIGGETWHTTVEEDGSWSVGIPSSTLSALPEGQNTITVIITDAAGNSSTVTHEIAVSSVSPIIAIDAISQDNVLNASEVGQPLTISGTSNLPDGSSIIVTLNGVNYETTVTNGVWSTRVPVDDVVRLGDAIYTVIVSGTDTTGNTGSVQATFQVDTALPVVLVSTFAGDNQINHAEAAVDQGLSGRVSGAAVGDTVTIKLGGKTYTTVVQNDLTWSVTVPGADLSALGDGVITVVASVTNSHGNTGESRREININTNIPGLRINTVSGDDIINTIEQNQDLVITGSSTHLSEGTVVTVTINGVNYSAAVTANGNWQVGVPASDLKNWANGELTIVARASDGLGNNVSIAHPVEVDLRDVAISVNKVSGDDILNALEKGADVVLSGMTQHVEAGQTVVIKFADHTYTTTVAADGSWSYTVPAADRVNMVDGRAEMTVSVTNVSGNSATGGREILVDTKAPTINLDSITDDNILSQTELGQDLVLTGTTDAQPGQIVTVTLNDKVYTAQVRADGSWSTTVPAADLAGLTDNSWRVSASVSDVAGNEASTGRDVLVYATIPVVTIDPVATNNVINQHNHHMAQVITGRCTGVAVGNTVTVTVNNVDYVTVFDANGNWSVGLPASVISGLADGVYTITASVTDKAGNTGSASQTVNVITTLPQITIDAIALDDVVNATEKGNPLTLSGTSNQPDGTVVTVDLNGKHYSATVTNNTWSVDVPVADVARLGEATYAVSASVTDINGNSNSTSHDFLVDSSLPVVTIHFLAGDDVINLAEVNAGQTLSGKVSNAAVGDTVTILLGGKSYTAVVKSDLSWSLPLSKELLAGLGDGDLAVKASVTNARGNTGSAEREISIDAQIPGLRIDTLSGDDVINQIEHGQNLIVSGSSSGLSAGGVVTVIINGKNYAASVNADGTWSTAVSAADVRSWPDGQLTVNASAKDSAGNPVSIGSIVDIDLAPVAVSINTISADNVLNALEKGGELVLSGSTSNVEAGQTITINFAGQTYTAQVQENGSWSYTVPAADMAALQDGTAKVWVSVTNVNGNSAAASHKYSVDTSAPTLTIDPLSGDNMLNATEIKQDLVITGISNAEAGQEVTLTLNGVNYTGKVMANGTWSVTVPAAALAALDEGSVTATATVSDKAGNLTNADRSMMVDVTVPSLTINNVAGDNILNASEHSEAQTISGTCAGAATGDVVTVQVTDGNGVSHIYTTTLDANGNWSVGISAAEISALGEGTYTVTASVTDIAGNSGSADRTITIDIAVPTIVISSVAGDDVINAVEKGQDLVLSGTSNQPAGTVIIVTLNGVNYQATTIADGSWSATVPASAVGNLGEATYTVTASVTDKYGNSNSTSHQILVDSSLPAVTINNVTADNILNISEIASGQAISGTVTGAAPGDTVTINLGGQLYQTTVQANLTWSLAVSNEILTALGDGKLTLTAKVTNGHGNTGSGSRDIEIDAQIPGLRVDTIAGDDVINVIEHNQNLIISGTSSGLGAGNAVTITVNGKNYEAIVHADGSWQAAVPGSDVARWSEGEIAIDVKGSSSAGNPVGIQHQVTVDLSEVVISINAIAQDNVLNAAEKGADLLLSGSTQNVEAGQTVTITFAGQTYTTTVQADGSWTYTVPAAEMAGLKNGDTSVQVSVTNNNGNATSASQIVTVDTLAPMLVIDPISQDNMLSAAEVLQALIITGSCSAEAGQIVTVTLEGKTYTGTVKDNGTWSVTVPAGETGKLTDGNINISASVQDRAGNPANAARDVLVDITVPTIGINAITTDNIINQTEHGQAQIISGTSTGAQAGDIVMVTIGDQTYSSVIDAAGNWIVGVPVAVIGGLADGNHTVTATLTDKAGNSGDTSHSFTVNTSLPTLTIHPVADDNALNATEKTDDVIISGTSTGLASGTAVTVTLNGKNYRTTVDENGNWTTTVSAEDVANLGEAFYQISVSATDSAGNTGSQNCTLEVSSTLPGVLINIVAVDDVINIAEIATGQTITGQVTGAMPGATVMVTIGGVNYTTIVQPDNTWSLAIGSEVLTALGNGTLTIHASVADGVGNIGTGSRDITIDAGLPGIRINTVAGDDVVNAIEHDQSLIVTGSSSGLSAGSTITVSVNGKEYAASVLANGSWQAAIPAADVSKWAAGDLTLTATGSSSAGNSVSIGHTVKVDLSEVAISINTVTTDDVLNAAEKGTDLLLGGTTKNVEAGQTVYITFAGRTCTAQVQANGSWSCTVPAADMSGLKDGNTVVQVSVANSSGNGASAGREVRIDTVAPTLQINTISGDNVLNASETGQPVVITGTSNAEAGQSVTVRLNGVDYSGTVAADGTWSVTVPAENASALNDGTWSVTASVSDMAGNSSSASRNLNVDVTAPVVTINTVAGDDVINLTEHGQAQIISGTSSGAATGDRIVLTINGNSYTTTVDAAGNWSVGVPASVVSGLENGSVTIIASITDAAGNTGSGSREVIVNIGVPSLSFDVISGDNVLNASEKGSSLTLSGTSVNLAPDTTVTVTLNGKNYTTTTDASGKWSLNVAANDLAALGEANYTLTASANSSVGNSTSASTILQVDTASPIVTINPLTPDNVLNVAEVAAGQTLSGKVSNAAAGDIVTVSLGGKSWTATVQADLSWSVSVPAAILSGLGNGDLKVTASVTNQHGNTGSAGRDFTIDASLPGIRINTVAGDDVVNAIEHQQSLIVTGSSSGLSAGSTITVSVNGKEYAASVLDNGSWQAAIPAADVSKWAAGDLTLNATGSSSAGNSVSIGHTVKVDLSEVAISINTVTTDDVLNAAEKGTDLLLGGVTKNVEAGQTVYITFAGRTATVQVQANGSWSYTVPAADMSGLKDGNTVVQVSVANSSGNGASAGREVRIDTVAPTLQINTISGDNVLNASETGQPVIITGTSNAEAGQSVTVRLNGVDYSGTVAADGTWSVTVPAENASALNDGTWSVTASVSDMAGNSSSASRNLNVDVTAPLVTINTVAGDDVINLTEHGQAQIISGTSSGAATGDRIVLTINGNSYTTTVDAAGNWSVGVPASVVSGLENGSVTITASVTDTAGNTGSGSREVTVNLGVPSLSFDAISGDNVLNASEKGSSLTLSGTSVNLAPDTTVTVTLNGKNYTTTTDASGKWSLNVAANDLAALGEANYTLTASANSSVGNSTSASTILQVDTASPTVTINPLTPDNVLNAAEVAAGQTLSGKVSNAAAGDIVTVSLGGKSWTAIVQADLSWSVSVPAAILSGLGNGDLKVTASVTNQHGNTGSAGRDFTIDASLPGIRINTVAGDDVVNAIEHQQSLIVTGSSSGLSAGSTITVSVNGKEYVASVLANGSWQAAIPAADVSKWAAGDLTLTATGSSSAGNSVSIGHTVKVDLSEVAISINTVTTDDVLNAAEKGTDLLLGGTTKNVEAGQTIYITFAGRTATVQVQANGSWSYTVPAADMSGLKDGNTVVQVSVANSSGNGASAGREIRVDSTAPTLAIDTVAMDNVINSSEAQAGVTITGTTNAEAGQTVTLTLNGRNYTGTVAADGSWSIELNSVALGALANNGYILTAKVSDIAGNESMSDKTITLDTAAPVISFNTVAGDDVINLAEHSQAQIISGTSSGAAAGDKIVITINGNSYTTTVDAAGNWLVGVPASVIASLQDGQVVISATLTDSAGNPGSKTHVVQVNTAQISLTINTIAGDDVINATEAGQPLVISGNSSQLTQGTKIYVTLNGVSYESTIKEGGIWSVTVPADKVQNLISGSSYVVTITASDNAGNSASASHDIAVDTVAPALTIADISTDNLLNAAEKQLPLTIHGTSNAEAGQKVTVMLGNTSYQATVQADGTWSVIVPVADLAKLEDANYTISATVNDKAGNPGSASHELGVDSTAPTITFDAVAGDNVINTAEQQAGQVISGTTTAEPGQTITITFNNHHYTAQVSDTGTWSVNVPASDFLGATDGGYTISATVSDKAGNSGAASKNVTLSGELPTLSIDSFAVDDIVNAAEHNTPLVISGATTAQAGQTVTITLNGKSYTTTVNSEGKWSYTLGSSAVAELADGSSYVIHASVNNSIGNSATADRTINIDTTAPQMTITIDSLQSDTGLSATDFITANKNVVLNGSLGASLSNNEKAQITLDGGKTWIDLSVNGTSWSYTDDRTLSDGIVNYTVRVVDNAGNVGATSSRDVVIDTVAPEASKSITVESISGDTGVSDSDFITSDNTLTLQGKLGAALAAGEYAQISIDGGKTWVDVNISGATWSYVDSRTLPDGDYIYQLRVIDVAGNIGSSTSQLVTVDTVAPLPGKTITIDSISDDTGISDSDFITKDPTLTLHGSLGGTLINGEYAQISLDGGVTWQNVTVAGTSWYFTDGRTLQEGTHTYWVRVIDEAGNVGHAAQKQVTVDLTPPDASKTITIDWISDDTGTDNRDFLTNDTSLTLYGSLSAPLIDGEYVEISFNNGVTWHQVSVDNVNWSFVDTRTLTEGVQSYQVRVVDHAGNVGQTARQDVTIDLTPPDNSATIDSYTDSVGSSRGIFSSGTVTDDRMPVLNGSLSTALQQGETVRIYDGSGNLLGTAEVEGTRWTFALTEPLIDGEVGTFHAVVADYAGNESEPSAEFTFTVDLEMVVTVQDTLDTTPIIAGRVDFAILDGEYVEVTVNGKVYSSRNGVVVIDPNNSTWYIQIPDADVLPVGTYNVQAGLYAKNGTLITSDNTTNELKVSASPVIDFTSSAATTRDTSTALTMSEDGTWRILSNSTVFTQNGTSSSTLGSFSQVTISGPDRQQQSSFIDFDRDGLMDILGADTSYANGQQSFKYNADGSYTSFQVGAYGVNGQPNDANGNAYVWYGGFMGIDIDGDGYVDLVYGDETPNDAELRGGYDTTFIMNTNGTVAGFDKSGNYVYSQTNQDGVPATNSGNPTPDREVSGVDLNNDGYVDIIYHGTVGTNRTQAGGSSAATNRLVVVSNGVDSNGNTTLTNTQVVTGVFNGDAINDNYYTTMTWADLNGDGYMDLFVAGYTGQGNANSAIFYNDGAGNLTASANGVGAGSSVQKLGDNVNSTTSLAVDWNGDGKMDLIEVAGVLGPTAANNANNIAVLWTNNGVMANSQVSWSNKTLLTGANQGGTNFVTGALSLDLDYDGDKDLVIFRAAGGKTEYIENQSVINNGTSIILRISDANGINVFYGNTVLLVDESTGKVVSSQVINPQGGVNMNDSSGLVYFYGLDANKSYSAVLLSHGNDFGGVSSVSFDSSGSVNSIENVNASWGGLKAVEKNHAYVLTAENGEAAQDNVLAASDGSNITGIVGTGYNDTLFATAGNHVYNGGGGSQNISDSNAWVAEGGMDIVDYKLAGSKALTIDLSNTSTQNTGFGLALFKNIEGIAGGSGNDVFTGSKGDNLFEGRGGDDTFNIGNGGHDTLLYKLLDSASATGGNGSDVVNGFTVGTWEGTADTDRIDLSDLLKGSGYSGDASARYINGVAQLDASAGNIADYIKVIQNGSNTEIHIDRDGAGNRFDSTAIVTLNGVQTDLATLLANHQLIVV